MYEDAARIGSTIGRSHDQEVRAGRQARKRIPFANLSFAVAFILVAVATLFSTNSRVGFAQEPEILVELDRAEVYEGEAVRFRVLLNYFPQDVTPDLGSSDQYRIRLVSRTFANQSFRSTINGRTQSVVRRGPLYEYELTPTSTGNLALPIPSATLDGKTYKGNASFLNVVAPGNQDLATIKISTEPESVYPLQPFRVRLTMYVKPLPDPYTDRDPLEIRRTLPTLTMPWAKQDDSLPEGLVPEKSWDLWLGRLIDHESYGVSINDLQQRRDLLSDFFNGRGPGGSGRGRDPFDLLRDSSTQRERRFAFRPKPTRELRPDGRGRMVEYWKYEFDREFSSERTIEYEFGPATLKGVFVARVNTRGGVEGESIYAVADAIKVRVSEPPEEGRPTSYTGAIGQFTCGAQLTPTTARVGDPLTLRLWLRGDGTLDRAIAPKLEDIPEIASRFKVYEATEDTQGSTRRFTYSLRPKQADIAQFPQVPLSYFDVGQEQYVTLKTDPIPLEISEADKLASNEIAMATSPTRSNNSLETSGEGIFANITSLSELRDESVQPDLWFGSLGGLAGLFVVLAVATKHAHRIRGDESAQRRRGAASRARRRITSALMNKGSSQRDLADNLGAGITGLVADVADLSEEGLTSKDAARHLREFGIEESLVERMESLLAECDGARYGASSASMDGLGDSASSLLGDLISALRKNKLLS